METYFKTNVIVFLVYRIVIVKYIYNSKSSTKQTNVIEFLLKFVKIERTFI